MSEPVQTRAMTQPSAALGVVRGVVPGLAQLPRLRGDAAALAALAGLIAFFGLLALAFEPQTYLHQLRHYTLLLAALAMQFGVMLWALALLVTMDQQDIVGGILRTTKTAAVRFLPATMLLIVLMSGFTTFKTSIPSLMPWWADAPLADLDALIHGGDPAVWLHRHLPGVIGKAAAQAYGAPWFALWLGTPVIVALLPGGHWRTRYLWAFALKLILLGVVTATLFASVGPVFYDEIHGGARFAHLEAAYETIPHIGGVPTYAGYLLEAYREGTLGMGTGISALPSVHCAAAFLNAFFFWSLNRWAGAAAWGFALLILIGSVYSGWHYALDGYASLLGIALIWFGTDAMLRRFAPSDTLETDESYAR